MHQLTALGFVKAEDLTASRTDFTLNFRSASALLRKEVGSARNKDIYFQAVLQVPKSHPMGATVGVSA